MSPMSWLLGDPEPSDKELAEAYRLFQLVNSQRQKSNLSPLMPLPTLDKAARKMALEMAKHDYTGGHQDTRKLWPDNRAKEAGYQWSPIAENLAQKHDSAQMVLSYWLKEQEYQRNIYDHRYTVTGVAYHNNNYVQVFGTQVRW